MKVEISRRLLRAFPDLEGDLEFIAEASHDYDPGICTDDLLVEARCHWNPWEFAGMAWPKEWSMRRSHFRSHKDGRITLTIGTKVHPRDIARLFSHELRHISQFNQGRRLDGLLGLHNMTSDESEEDAYSFEDLIVDKIGAFV